MVLIMNSFIYWHDFCLCVSSNLTIKNTAKKGKGVFATRNFKKESTLLHVNLSGSNRIISKKDINKLSLKDRSHLDYMGKGKYAIDYSIFSYINHSCNPNSYVKYINLKDKCVIAIKDIKKGEEITYDYSIDAVDNWKMKCNCGSVNCRKIIYGNFSRLPRKLQNKYFQYLPAWLMRKYKNE